MLIKFANNSKLHDIANTIENWNKIQNDFDKLENWVENNRMNFNRDKVLPAWA